MPPSFGTVLVKRKANERPKEWELRLRPICQKIRIVEKLLGGVHLMVPNSRVAVRIYDAGDISQLEGAALDDESPDGVDGLRNFRDSYEHSLVFFVLPSGQQQRDQLGRRDSFVNIAQKSLLQRDKTDENESDDGKKKHITRTAVVSDIPQVIQAIDSLIQSLAPEKTEKRRKYFAQVASQKFLPTAESQPTQEVIANHVMKTFNTWSERFDMPEGDSSVVLSMLGSLANVTSASARTLDDVPIRNTSKELITQFFGANAADDTVEETNMEEQQSNEEDEFYGADDSELLQCPDPTTQQDINQQTSHETPFPSRNLARNFEKAERPIVHHNQPFSGDFEFTPMVPPRQQPGYNATTSIFPESYTHQSNISQPPCTGIYQQMTSNIDYGNSMNYPAAGSSMPGSRAGNYQQSFHNGHHSGYQDTTQGYGGYSYSQSARYHTQQFM